MRLYLSDKEAKVIKTALHILLSNTYDFETEQAIYRVKERIDLCEQLQNSERRSNGYAK